MMCSIKGRIKIAVLVSFALVVILGLCFTEAGFTWGQTSAARAVVLALLNQVPPPQPAPDPQVTGREATPEEAADLDRTVSAYMDAIRARQYAAAWELLTNAGPEVDQESFVSSFKSIENSEPELRSEQLLLFLSGHKTRLVDLKTRDNQGVAHIAIDVSLPMWLSLLKRDGAWRIDPQGSEEVAARQAVSRQLEDIGRDTCDSILRQMLREQGRGGYLDYTHVLVLSPQSATHRITSHKLAADHAVVKLQTQGELHALLALSRSPAGWNLDLNEGFKFVPPDYRLALDRYGNIARPQSDRQVCMSNLKQLAVGMLAYCQDYDEKMPPADKWSSGIEPYIRNAAILKCPAVEKYGYAMNYKLSRQTTAQFDDPSEIIALFDSTLLRPNAYDVGTLPGASLPMPPRHEGFNNFAFVDGHVKAISAAPDLTWYTLKRAFGRPPRPRGPGRRPAPPGGPGGPPGAPGGPAAGGG